MAQTYGDLQTQALSDDFNSTKYLSVAKQAILDAVGEVARQVRLPFNEATYNLPLVNGTASYTLPAGATAPVRILSVYDATNHDPLAEVEPDVLDDLAPMNGRPQIFALYNTQVTLYPTPNVTPTITVRYLKIGGAPTSDTDVMATVTGIPEDYLHGLVEYARHRMFRLEDDAEMSAFWKNEWQETLRKLKGDVQRRDVGRKRQVPGMWQNQPGPRFIAP
jgi:hypothetical protein